MKKDYREDKIIGIAVDVIATLIKALFIYFCYRLFDFEIAVLYALTYIIYLIHRQSTKLKI